MERSRDPGAVGSQPTLDADPADAAAYRQPGTIVAGRFRLERLIGEGGMGTVWAAARLDGTGQVALKFLRGVTTFRPQARRRMLREARAAGAIAHPSVLRVHEILADAGAPVLVMDLLEGESLRARLAREGSLGVGETARILLPVLSAVGTAHAAGIVHRDLKPDNIFLTPGPRRDGDGDGCASAVKVLDFGLAKLTATEGGAQASGDLSRSGDLLGTPSYMAPEQAFGEVDVDHRADVWSLGVVLYECLAGTRPFPGENVGQVMKRIMTGDHVALPGAPEDVVALVERMLTVDRGARLSELAEAVTVLEHYAGVETPRFGAARRPAEGLQQSGSAPLGASLGHRPWVVALASLALFAVLAAAAAVLLRGRPTVEVHAAPSSVLPAPPAAGPPAAPVATPAGPQPGEAGPSQKASRPTAPPLVRPAPARPAPPRRPRVDTIDEL